MAGKLMTQIASQVRNPTAKPTDDFLLWH